VFYRERAAGMYSPLPFAIAQGNVEIPYLLFQTVICECPLGARCVPRFVAAVWL
jgi:hypothetical protein